MFARKKAILYLVAIFLAGLLAGGFAGFNFGRRTFFRPPRPADMAKHMSHRLAAELTLTPDQILKIDPILIETAAALDAIHENSGRQIAAIFKTNNDRIAVFLNPAQQQKLVEFDKRFRKPQRPETNREPARP